MNIWTGTGNLGQDPELRSTGSGRSVLNMSIACDRYFRRTNPDGSTERVNETDWIPVVVWGNLAETCAQYLQKGSKIAVTGELRQRTYTDRDDNKRTVYEVNASTVEFLGRIRSSADVARTSDVVATAPTAQAL